MKQNIHPVYHPKAKVRCACGKSYEMGATYQELSVEICGNCHPFYTGKEKLIDTAGRVEKFRARKERAKGAVRKKTEKRSAKKAKKAK